MKDIKQRREFFFRKMKTLHENVQVTSKQTGVQI